MGAGRWHESDLAGRLRGDLHPEGLVDPPRLGDLLERLQQVVRVSAARVEEGAVAERHSQAAAEVGDVVAVEQLVHQRLPAVEPGLAVPAEVVVLDEEEVARLEGLTRLLKLVVLLSENGCDSVVGAGDKTCHLDLLG